METQIGRWGNSLAVRIPRAFARQARLEDGVTVDLSISESCLLIRRSDRRYSLGQLVSGISAENRHSETDWGQSVGSEVW